MQWFLLGLAITVEVVATLSLKVATGGRPRWYAGVAAGYVTALVLLSLALDAGLGLGVAYGIWTATGVAATAILSRVLFKEPLTLLMTAGIGLIVAGVLLIELGASH
ncbi:DMT family transporter [Aeromicrobium chenweiae]|uniref:QacE family quaternary ammonium compound efflux SMR transporter n=1 Tax=Aeromicrobium chenweiae TaxID=2079793 RepID=A0A2S0WHY7_9ACTN|nr:SMR family transporter [Aeromicrobium chenweiae]AWB90956.1 QacE family quaternary ammonium compound efflux SMR transporter [Aeromicrobium chenweiae]TGN32176.1 QacE family quaternary ammonium compound efflux SMR transporter [Aeromicrobium chenweiae]